MSPLRERRFALLAVGQAVNAIGTWCALVALWGFASFRFHAGAGDLALLGFAWAVPALLLGPVAGVPIDRFGPKRVLVVADALAAAIALTFLLAHSFALLVVLGALEGATKSFAEPAFNALAPRIVADEQLAAANGVLSTAATSAIAAGPLLAAVSISAFGFAGAFVVNAATYLVGIAVLLPFRIGPPATVLARAPEPAGVAAEVRAAWRVVMDRRALRAALALAASVYVIWGAFVVVEPLYVRTVLGAGPTTFAWLQSAFGIALFLGSALVARLGDRVVRWSVVCGAAVASGLAAVAYVGTDSVVVAYLGLAAWGLATAGFVAPHLTLVQRGAPVEVHGRVLALNGTLHSAGDLVSLPIVGLLAAAFGVQLAGMAMAVIPVTGGLLVWRRMVSRAARPDPVPEIVPA